MSDSSPDGLTLFFEDMRGISAPLQLRLPDHRGPTVAPQARPGDRALRISPDGRFVAFMSNETGRDEIYVRPISPGRRTLVSTNGGSDVVAARTIGATSRVIRMR